MLHNSTVKISESYKMLLSNDLECFRSYLKNKAWWWFLGMNAQISKFFSLWNFLLHCENVLIFKDMWAQSWGKWLLILQSAMGWWYELRTITCGELKGLCLVRTQPHISSFFLQKNNEFFFFVVSEIFSSDKGEKRPNMNCNIPIVKSAIQNYQRSGLNMVLLLANRPNMITLISTSWQSCFGSKTRVLFSWSIITIHVPALDNWLELDDL